jgi:hypothetical protein
MIQATTGVKANAITIYIDRCQATLELLAMNSTDSAAKYAIILPLNKNLRWTPIATCPSIHTIFFPTNLSGKLHALTTSIVHQLCQD